MYSISQRTHPLSQSYVIAARRAQKYGMNATAYTELSIDVPFVKDHEITLTGLSPDATYYFVVNSTDQSDNSAESSENSFKYDW